MAERWLYGWGLGSVALGGASLVVPLYVVELGGGPFVLGVLAAVAAVVGLPAALGAGRIADRTGNRRGIVLAMLALIAVSVGVLPLFDGVAPVIVANGAIWFAFAAATPVLTLLAVADVPERAWSERIALLNQYQGVGWALGLLLGAVWTALGARFLPADAVIRWLFVPLTACAVLGLGLGIRTLPADPSPGADRRASGTRVRRAIRAADRFSVRSATFPFTPGRTDFRGLHPRRFVERFTPVLAAYFAAVFCFFAGFSAFFAPLPAFLTEVGFGSDGVFALYLVNSLGAAVFFGAAGRLSADRDVALLQVASLSTRAIALPAVALVGTAWGAAALGFGVAAAVFTLIGVTWAVIAVTAGTLVTRLAPAAIRGEALGMYAALGALAGGVGSVFGGWLAVVSYAVAFGAAGGLVLVGAAVVFLLRRHAGDPGPTDGRRAV
ncbi:major facilitator superfamily protein [Halorubrum aidingense JCM 13560]|uniref:Major facilitator superfamily protein n=1 Tax=Halorubrum aidingense JCM 13560 TaxID=1230454 RepID=M0PM37_9EURY|nr:MFS transporter [Halorubrum aidingense]EMA69825.1 major facilitator superfamily protein [Halorubrum aidingense JCM 13560]